MLQTRILVAGQTSDGANTLGNIIATAFADYMDVKRTSQYPSEQGAGLVEEYMTISPSSAFHDPSSLDCIVALDRGAVEKGLPRLERNGIIVYDASIDMHEFEQLTQGKEYTLIPVDRTSITRKLDTPRARNMAMLGAVERTFGLEKGFFSGYVRNAFSTKSPTVIEKNVAALDLGYCSVSHTMQITLDQKKEGVIFSTGSKVLAMSALDSGNDCSSGYPITPATKLMEAMQAGIVKKRQSMLQADPTTPSHMLPIWLPANHEESVFGTTLGMALAGRRVFCCSAEEGLAKGFQSALAPSLIYQVPFPLAVMMRMGPGTGRPTMTSQGGYAFIQNLAHGDINYPVIASSGHLDLAYLQMRHLINLTEAYHMGGVFVGDAYLDSFQSSLTIPQGLPLFEREYSTAAGLVKPHMFTSTGVSPLPHYRDSVASVDSLLATNVFGQPDNDPVTLTALYRSRMLKLLEDRKGVGPYLMRATGEERPEIALIGWGTMDLVNDQAVLQGLDNGASMGSLDLYTIKPFPQRAVVNYLAGVGHKVVVVEMSMGQFSQDIQLCVQQANNQRLREGKPELDFQVIPYFIGNRPTPQDIYSQVI